MCDALRNNAIAGDQHWLAEGFAGCKDGPLVRGEGSIDEDPVRDSAVSRKRDGGEVGFAFEIVGLGKSSAPIDGVEGPSCFDTRS